MEFEPIRKNGIIVSKLCTSCLIVKGREMQRKQWKLEKRVLKEKMKTKSDYLRELQTVFNKYVRLRDYGKPCISCGNILRGKYDAGHCYSVGAYPNLRFDEDNVHGQCVACNQHRHGNLNEYVINLPKRIGKKRYKELINRRNEPKNYTVSEVKEMIALYKLKCKEIESSRC